VNVFIDHEVRIRAVAVGPYDNNVYTVTCLATGRGLLIDAAADHGPVLEMCSDTNIERILITHGHGDHIAALDPIRQALDVPWAMHPDDVEIAGRIPDESLTDRQEIRFGNLMLHVLHTPGHTPGSVSFVIEPVILSGDTLFPGGPGATRWEYSSFGEIMDSIVRSLFTYPDPTLFFPGHGPGSSIGAERPELEIWRRRGW
jgi:glyoxylase-like metal-dependent hydrolase (beta-lactamase superfamily II)